MYKRYDNYKESGVAWLGEIPSHWEVKRLKFVANINMGQSPKSEDYNHSGHGMPFLQGNAEFGPHHPTPKIYCPTAKKHAQAGNILLSVRAPVGALNIADQKYGIGRGLCAIQTKADRLERDYARYLFEVVRTELNVVATGSTYDAVSVDEVSNMTCVQPTLDEQRAIANFLDHKTTEINRFITDGERFIGLLNKQKAAIINHAVTKGLHPKVQMKPSEVEWIGEIPEHSELKRLKYVADLNMGQSPPSEEYNYDRLGAPFLQGNAEFGPHHPTPKIYCPTAKKYANPGDILLSVRAPVGAINIADQEYGIGRGLCAICPRTNQLERHYAKYLLEVTRTELHVVATGSTYDAVTIDEVSNIISVVLPLSEQHQIANFLDHETKQIDELVSKEHQKIEFIKQYRQVLISQAGTGKIDVRKQRD